MEDEQYKTCQKYGTFVEQFCGIYVRPPTETSIAMIMEQIIEHHLTTK